MQIAIRERPNTLKIITVAGAPLLLPVSENLIDPSLLLYTIEEEFGVCFLAFFAQTRDGLYRCGFAICE